MSDLHFEYHADAGRALVAACHAPEADVLVLAGDIAMAEGIPDALALFSERYPNVIYVHGNHEYYGSTRERVVAITREACARLGNVHWLDASAVEIKGTRFFGAPLWFPENEAAVRHSRHLNDFRQITGAEAWVYREHQRARRLLEEQVRPGDVVISHHLPAEACVLPQYKDHPLNCFFVAGVEDVLEKTRPALWMHGHTHGNVDVVIGETRVLCNPHGYVKRDENPGFRPRFVVEV
jgi:predicted phosphohydrolase